MQEHTCVANAHYGKRKVYSSNAAGSQCFPIAMPAAVTLTDAATWPGQCLYRPLGTTWEGIVCRESPMRDGHLTLVEAQ